MMDPDAGRVRATKKGVAVYFGHALFIYARSDRPYRSFLSNPPERIGYSVPRRRAGPGATPWLSQSSTSLVATSPLSRA